MCRKVMQFDSTYEAYGAIASLSVKNGEPEAVYSPYWCNECRCYHIGHNTVPSKYSPHPRPVPALSSPGFR